MKKIILIPLIIVFGFNVSVAQKVITLESTHAAPDMQWDGGERTQISEWDHMRTVSNVSQPSLTVYLPEGSEANGTALIIAPGGGFHTLAIDHEGIDVATWCVENGIAAFVLKYRLVPTGENPGAEFFQKLQNGQEQMDREIAPYIALAKADGLAAIEYVRSHAGEFNIKTNQIGIIGFSAGGTVAAAAGLEYTSEDNRPDFIAPIYAAMHVLNLEKLPSKPMPLFMAVASDDMFGFQKETLKLYKTWNAAKVPAEMHVYESGNHGFGMRRQDLPSDQWIDTFKNWIGHHGWLHNYRDLNKNGKKDIYEDSTQPVEKRVEDLLSQMTLEEKAGLLFNSSAAPGNEQGQPPALAFGEQVSGLHINHFGMPGMPTAKAIMDLNNEVQKIAENTRLGIPVTWYTDPRHLIRYNEAAGENRYYSRWPSELGLAAIGDPNLVREFGDIARQEYLAGGIRLALHPMADLATEPRWFRTYTTFGEDADLATKLLRAYIEGFQGEKLGPHSVLTMTKHFPGGGPQKDGWDAHFASGKEQVYPGGKFDYHLKPFVEGAIPAGTAQMMLYYGVPVGIMEEQVAFGYNKEIVTGLLRDSLDFNGVVSTDWGLITDNFAKDASAWGVEDLSPKERTKKILDAGVDMFGGEASPQYVVELVNEGEVSEERLDQSVRRVLRDKFVIGLFDDPYVDEEQLNVFENEEFKEKGREAQRKSLILLKNENNILPLSEDQKVYLHGMNRNALEGFAQVVESPDEADVILFKFNTPYTPVTEGKLLERIFHQGRMDFPDDQKQEYLDLIQSKPTISIMTMDRPAVIPEINEQSRALIADFHTEDRILAELIFGEFHPTGKLPVEIPSSVEAVEEQLEDVPHDSKDPLYPFGFGLDYSNK